MAGKGRKKVPNWLLGDPGTGGASDPDAHESAQALAEAIHGFRALYPREWEELRLCPLQHGIETILEKLKAHRAPPRGRSADS